MTDGMTGHLLTAFTAWRKSLETADARRRVDEIGAEVFAYINGLEARCGEVEEAEVQEGPQRVDAEEYCVVEIKKDDSVLFSAFVKNYVLLEDSDCFVIKIPKENGAFARWTELGGPQGVKDVRLRRMMVTVMDVLQDLQQGTDRMYHSRDLAEFRRELFNGLR